MGTIEIIGLALMIVGFILCVIEMLIPGFGVSGITGIVALIAGVCMKADSFSEGLTYTVIVVVGLAVAMTIILLTFRSRKIKSPLLLSKEMEGKDSFLSNDDLNYLVGKKGKVVTGLRPAGKIDINGVEFDVRSETQFIEKGTEVTIIRIQNGSIIVK